MSNRRKKVVLQCLICQQQWDKLGKGTFHLTQQVELSVFFLSRREQHNKCVTEQCPEKLLEEPTVELLKYWLSLFVAS